MRCWGFDSRAKRCSKEAHWFFCSQHRKWHILGPIVVLVIGLVADLSGIYSDVIVGAVFPPTSVEDQVRIALAEFSILTRVEAPKAEPELSDTITSTVARAPNSVFFSYYGTYDIQQVERTLSFFLAQKGYVLVDEIADAQLHLTINMEASEIHQVGGLFSSIGKLQASMMQLEIEQILWSDSFSYNGGATSANEIQEIISRKGLQQMIDSLSEASI